MSWRPTGGIVSGGIITPVSPTIPSAGGGEPPPLLTGNVWPLRLFPSLTLRKVFTNVVFDFGDGYEQRANKNQQFMHGNGMGVITFHRGLWEFDITLTNIAHANGDITQEVNKLWAFAIDRVTSFTPFYFYNPMEAPTIDLTGASTVGRYYVRFKDNIVSLENLMLRLHNGKLTLIEVRP